MPYLKLIHERYKFCELQAVKIYQSINITQL
jgi:hypothetical protein